MCELSWNGVWFEGSLTVDGIEYSLMLQTEEDENSDEAEKLQSAAKAVLTQADEKKKDVLPLLRDALEASGLAEKTSDFSEEDFRFDGLLAEGGERVVFTLYVELRNSFASVIPEDRVVEVCTDEDWTEISADIVSTE